MRTLIMSDKMVTKATIELCSMKKTDNLYSGGGGRCHNCSLEIQKWIRD